VNRKSLRLSRLVVNTFPTKNCLLHPYPGSDRLTQTYQVCDNIFVADLYIIYRRLVTVTDLLKRCSKPSFKQVSSKIEVTESGIMTLTSD